MRSDLARRERERVTAADVVPEDVPDTDDTLVLLFLCCHPALTAASQTALTLRAVGGLTTAEIARAFLVPEATLAARVSRAKQRIKAAGSSFRMPDGAEREERLRVVLHVLYLIFNEGYTASSGSELHRADLAHEAIRLARMVHALGPYQLQAAIAATHADAATAGETNWPQVHALYLILERIAPNPMVTLNRAIALAETKCPLAGLTLLATLDCDERMTGHHRLLSVPRRPPPASPSGATWRPGPAR